MAKEDTQTNIHAKQDRPDIELSDETLQKYEKLRCLDLMGDVRMCVCK